MVLYMWLHQLSDIIYCHICMYLFCEMFKIHMAALYLKSKWLRKGKWREIWNKRQKIKTWFVRMGWNIHSVTDIQKIKNKNKKNRNNKKQQQKTIYMPLFGELLCINHFFSIIFFVGYFCRAKCFNGIDLILGPVKRGTVKHLMLKYIASRDVCLLNSKTRSIYLSRFHQGNYCSWGRAQEDGDRATSCQTPRQGWLPFPAVLCHQITSQCNQRWIKYFFSLP